MFKATVTWAHHIYMLYLCEWTPLLRFLYLPAWTPDYCTKLTILNYQATWPLGQLGSQRGTLTVLLAPSLALYWQLLIHGLLEPIWAELPLTKSQQARHLSNLSPLHFFCPQAILKCIHEHLAAAGDIDLLHWSVRFFFFFCACSPLRSSSW